MLKIALPAVALMALVTTPAFALEVTKTTTVAASPDKVWKTIGGFCGIGDWHPLWRSAHYPRRATRKNAPCH